MEKQPVIKITDLKKSYKNGDQSNEVLKGINLQVDPGQIIGYIGPNGAGKSTTVKIICGLIGSFHGKVEVAGFDIKENPVEIKKRIGYIPEIANLYDSVSPIEFFSFLANMRGLDQTKTIEKANRLMALFEIEKNAHQRIGSFSKGMKQKVLFISALLHNPEILFMDEPLTGLDANSVIIVKSVITQMAAEGKTIFYSSHLMDVVEKVSDRIILINHGQIIADGTFAEINAQSKDQSLEMLFSRLTGKNEDNNRQISEAIFN
jgi:ABC-2 type transport system ATP-binding protein